jgi:hypothetical protein
MKNIITFGGPGAGKSAFGNALLDNNPNGARFCSQSAPG